MNEDYTFKIVYAVGSTDKIGGWENKDFVKKIEEDTGLKIQWVGIPEASYNDQVAIMIAAGDLPDAFIGQIPNFAQFLDSFVKMNDMIDDYAPSLKEFFDKYPNIKLAGMFPDGSIYGLPEVQLDGYVAGKSLAINKKWLDAVGMEMPETADELFDVLMAFKTQDPNGNGQADEIPFAFYKDRKFDILKSAFGFAGYDEKDYKYPYLQVVDGKVDFYPVSENYHAYLQYLNKLYSNGLIDPNGFIQEEVEGLLAYYDLSEQLEEVKKWYDGYLFNDFEIYNPWSILKYVNDRKDHVTEFALPYWSNTSSNSIVREMVGEADEMAKADLETLMAGGTIEKQVHEDITYGDIHQTQDNLWNFLFFTGYLKKVGERTVDNNLWLEMKIPNIEVATIYENSISYWFEHRMKETDRSPL